MNTNAPRLMLFTPSVADAAGFADALGVALARRQVAAVALALAAGEDRALVNIVKTLAPIAQEQDAALLVVDRPEIVARGGADGVHMSGPGLLRLGLELKSQNRIVGCGGLESRDDAMAAAEAGADYVMFGAKMPDGSVPPISALLERIAWWAEIFEVPCVAFSPSIEAIDDLAAAGADFVALGEPVWTSPDGPGKTVEAAWLRIAMRTAA